MWMVWETGSKSLREIGELFGGLDYAALNSQSASPALLATDAFFNSFCGQPIAKLM
jgi:hypothetical protein